MQYNAAADYLLTISFERLVAFSALPMYSTRTCIPDLVIELIRIYDTLRFVCLVTVSFPKIRTLCCIQRLQLGGIDGLVGLEAVIGVSLA